MDNNEINSIILKIYEEQKKTSNKIDKLEKSIDGKISVLQNGLQGQINGLQEQVNGLQEQVNGLQGQVNGLQEQVNEMQVQVNKIPKIEEELRTLSGRVAVIEKEHGEKLQILLDVVTGNSKKSKELEKRIEKDEKIINRHSDEIYYLKEKVQEA